MNEYTYTSGNVRKKVLTDNRAYVGCVFENLISGSRLKADGCGFEICYSYGANGRKIFFSEKDASIENADARGYVARCEHDGIWVKVIYEAAARAKSTVSRFFLSKPSSDSALLSRIGHPAIAPTCSTHPSFPLFPLFPLFPPFWLELPLDC